MAESGMEKFNFDIDIMKETLCAQQQLLQKLYNELDAEREASSSAASEALSVILRFQGEKAAVQMEAEQYKRLAEEKMCYAEESLSIFEDIMYQKEMEVAALDYQVQAYRYKLLSLGCADPGIGEIKFPENLLQRNETLVGEMNLKNLGRRNSAPLLSLKSHMKKAVNEYESSSSPDVDVVTKTVESCKGQDINDLSPDWEKKTDSYNIGDISSYLEQIRKLDGRVKEIAGVSYANLRSSSRSPSPLSQSSGNPYDPTKGVVESSPSLLHSTLNEIDHVKPTGNSLETEITNDGAGSPGVLDVFEVPQVDQRYDNSQLKRRNQKKKVALDEEVLQKPDFFEETVKSFNQDENYWLNKVLKSSNQEKDICIPSDDVEVDCNLAIGHPRSRVSASQPKLQHPSQTSEIVEVEGLAIRQEYINREEELKLLREIREQISSIQCEIKNWKTKKAAPTPRDELAFNTLAEAMLYFWM